MPDRNDEHGIRITFDGNRRRYYGNAFDDVIPQRRLVVADQCWADGTSNAPTKIAGTENDGWVETVIKPQKSSGGARCEDRVGHLASAEIAHAYYCKLRVSF